MPTLLTECETFEEFSRTWHGDNENETQMLWQLLGELDADEVLIQIPDWLADKKVGFVDGATPTTFVGRIDQETEKAIRFVDSTPAQPLIVDVKTLYIFDVHCTATKKHDVKIGSQVARRNAADLRSLSGDKGFDSKRLLDDLRADRIRPLIPHRIYSSLDKAHNARINRRLYNRRWMVETVISSIKRTLGSAVRARTWHLEFREMVFKCAVYNLRRTVRFQ